MPFSIDCPSCFLLRWQKLAQEALLAELLRGGHCGDHCHNSYAAVLGVVELARPGRRMQRGWHFDLGGEASSTHCQVRRHGYWDYSGLEEEDNCCHWQSTAKSRTSRRRRGGRGIGWRWVIFAISSGDVWRLEEAEEQEAEEREAKNIKTSRTRPTQAEIFCQAVGSELFFYATQKTKSGENELRTQEESEPKENTKTMIFLPLPILTRMPWLSLHTIALCLRLDPCKDRPSVSTCPLVDSAVLFRNYLIWNRVQSCPFLNVSISTPGDDQSTPDQRGVLAED